MNELAGGSETVLVLRAAQNDQQGGLKQDTMTLLHAHKPSFPRDASSHQNIGVYQASSIPPELPCNQILVYQA